MYLFTCYELHEIFYKLDKDISISKEYPYILKYVWVFFDITRWTFCLNNYDFLQTCILCL